MMPGYNNQESYTLSYILMSNFSAKISSQRIFQLTPTWEYMGTNCKLGGYEEILDDWDSSEVEQIAKGDGFSHTKFFKKSSTVGDARGSPRVGLD